jgi:hypothetical protein
MDSEYVPVEGIRNYVWRLLQTRLDWSSDDYNGLVPIVPAAREPEFASLGQPYITYGWSAETDGDDWYLPTEVVVFSVYGAGANVVNEAVKVISNALRRQDESARDVNAWIHSPANPYSEEFDGLTFGFLRLTNVEGPGPEAQEGGWVDGLVAIRYSYAISFDKDEFKV